jgi:hypothetical protein
MKNIHLISTDKPSRIVKNTNNQIKLTIQTLPKDLELGCYPQNIYITNDKKIKEGDWHFNLALNLVEKTTSFHNGLLCEKIILTTDQDLIKDGVRAIDDEFLEWFVKNPSCERVEVEIKPMFPMYSTFIESIDNPPFYGNLKRKIIIPQEEPKQETLEEANWKVLGTKNNTFYNGAKWQQERMYTEEEVGELVYKIMGEYANKKNIFFKGDLINNLFEQFKKK